MESHFRSLLTFVPDLLQRKVLDLGSGRGKFLVDMAKRGAHVVGYERSSDYVEISRKALADAGHGHVEVIRGMAEELPFSEASFGFVNVSEVIEHVEDPHAILMELYRVIEPGGYAYVSAPNRFGYRDPHYHLYFVNWMPRKFSDMYVRLRRMEKSHDGGAGRQELSAMHYYTHDAFCSLAHSIGWEVQDTRSVKIRRMPFAKRIPGIVLYAMLRPWYFDTFHFLLRKPA